MNDFPETKSKQSICNARLKLNANMIKTLTYNIEAGKQEVFGLINSPINLVLSRLPSEAILTRCSQYEHDGKLGN